MLTKKLYERSYAFRHAKHSFIFPFTFVEFSLTSIDGTSDMAFPGSPTYIFGSGGDVVRSECGVEFI